MVLVGVLNRGIPFLNHKKGAFPVLFPRGTQGNLCLEGHRKAAIIMQAPFLHFSMFCQFYIFTFFSIILLLLK